MIDKDENGVTRRRAMHHDIEGVLELREKAQVYNVRLVYDDPVEMVNGVLYFTVEYDLIDVENDE